MDKFSDILLLLSWDQSKTHPFAKIISADVVTADAVVVIMNTVTPASRSNTAKAIHSGNVDRASTLVQRLTCLLGRVQTFEYVTLQQMHSNRWLSNVARRKHDVCKHIVSSR